MKYKSYLILFFAFFCCFFTTQVFATRVIVGDTASTSNDYNPFYSAYDYVYEANLYLLEELPASFTIYRLDWYNYYAELTTLSNVKIYLKNVTFDTIPVQDWTTIKSSATLVYSGSITFAGLGWGGVNLSSTFSYNSSYNLLMLTEMTAGSGGGSYKYSSLQPQTHGRLSQDGSAPTDPFYGSNDRVNIMLSNNAAPDAPEIDTPTVDEIYVTSFIAKWICPGAATNYRLDVSTDSAFGSFVTGFNNKSCGNVASCSVTGLTQNTTYYYRVRAYNSYGTSASSQIAMIRTYTTPEAPAPLPATNGRYNKFHSKLDKD